MRFIYFCLVCHQLVWLEHFNINAKSSKQCLRLINSDKYTKITYLHMLTNTPYFHKNIHELAKNVFIGYSKQ